MKNKKFVMEIIPAIDLLQGSCVRLNQGDYSKVTKFNPDPVQQAIKWQDQGASRLHLVDLDGAKTGKPINATIIREIAKVLSIPIQLGGGVRSFERAEQLISYGIDRVILGTIAIEDPQLIKELARIHPERIIIGIDAKEGKVATRGWIKQSDVDACDLAKSLSKTGITAIICTDIATDGTLKGPNIKAMKDIASVSNVPVIASGGVGCMADLLSLLELKPFGVTGVIVGRALYDGTINLEEAIKVMDNSQLQDQTLKEGNFYA